MTSRPPSLTLALLLALGCGESAVSNDPMDDPGGKADDNDTKPDVVDPTTFGCVQTGGATPEQIAELNDPIARHLIKAKRDGMDQDCPANQKELIDKLSEVDPDGCVPGEELKTAIVSDDARMSETASNYRTVTARNCGSDQPQDLLWTILGLESKQNKQTLNDITFLEMMAFDRSAGVYNYYTFNGGRFSFEGNSIQVADGEAGCSCHGAGGVMMKELDAPHMHFASELHELPRSERFFDHANTPIDGNDETAIFGRVMTGAEFSELTNRGNEATVAGRIAHHRKPETGDARKLLLPLFCADQLNLDSAGDEPTVIGPDGALADPNDSQGQIRHLPPDFFVDPFFGGENVPMDDVVYEAAIREVDQVVNSVPGVTPRDKAFKFVYPERSGIDIDYVEHLLAEGIIDTDFAADVLSIDFTMPLFSDTRCSLGDFAPTFAKDGAAADPANGTIDEATPEQIKAAFIGRLKSSAPGADTPAGRLLANLQDEGDEAAHRDRVAAFFEACQARPQEEMMMDALQVAHGIRREARSFIGVIEHAEQMPDMGQGTPFNGALVALDPETCTLPD